MLTYNGLIRTKKFCPTLFQYHHPNLLASCRSSKERLTVLIYRYIIINYNFFKCTKMSYLNHVNSIFIYFQVCEDIFYAKIILCNCSKCTKKIAISKRSLKNVFRRNSFVNKFSVPNNVRNSFPLDIFSYVSISKRLLAWLKIKIKIKFISILKFRTKLLILWP